MNITRNMINKHADDLENEEDDIDDNNNDDEIDIDNDDDNDDGVYDNLSIRCAWYKNIIIINNNNSWIFSFNEKNIVNDDDNDNDDGYDYDYCYDYDINTF